MKKLLIAAIVFCLFLTSCYSRFTHGVSREWHSFDDHDFSDTKNITEIADLLDSSGRYCKYSDLKDNKDILFYFDLLDDDEYVKVHVGSSDYVLFYYTVTGYGKKIEDVSNVKSSITGSHLSVTADITIYDGPSSGCLPQTDYCRCIVKVDGDFDSFCIDDKVYRPFDGGVFFLGSKRGIVGTDLSIKVPLVYQQITLEECVENPNFYLMKTEDGISLLNKDYDLIFGRDDLNFVFLENDNLLITYKYDDRYFISKIDSSGKELQDPIKGWLEIPSNSNSYGQYVFSVGIGQTGVIDEDLNEIIKPEYDWIEIYESHVPDLWIVGKDDKCAVFDLNGEQKTGFLYDTVYEAVQAYNDNQA